MLHDPSTEYLQWPIVLPFGFPVYDNCTGWEYLRNVIVELLSQTIRILVILLYPVMRHGLLVLHGGNGRGVAHDDFGGRERCSN